MKERWKEMLEYQQRVREAVTRQEDAALAAARREGAEEALREAAEWHKAEAAKARSEAERLIDWGRWWRGDETWRDRAELHERAAAHLLGEKA